MYAMTDVYQNLQKIGLTRNQASIYLALFRMGEAKAGALIRKTGFHRNLVYTALSELVEKKLVGVSKSRGTAVYKTLSPGRLLGDIQEKEAAAKEAIRELTSLSRGNTQEIIVYEGIDEFRRQEEKVWAIPEPGGVIRFLGTSPRWFEVIGPSLAEDLIEIQNAKRMRLEMLTHTISKKDHDFIKKTKGFSKIKKHPLIASDTNVTAILDDRIFIRSYVEPYFVVEIINSELAKNYKNYFDHLWRQA